MDIPRIVVSASASGVGKTTMTVGLIAALRARGLKVAAFKCGPDYLDPSYHARAAGRPSQNLDGWMMGREAVLATFASASRGADIAIIEGMMGLFDGATPTGDEGSTAEIAKWLGAPVLLVIDASGIARTVAAIALGFARFDGALNLAGLICNRVGSGGHLELLRAATPTIAIVGGLPSNNETAFPERHLGLFAADEKTVSGTTITALSKAITDWCDLDRIIAIARGAPPLGTENAHANVSRRDGGSRCRLGVALDDAFHFYYEDNLRRLERIGVEIVNFAPSRDQTLPVVDGLYFGGGYPEALAPQLSSNTAMLEAIRLFAASGGPIYAECGGLMYLSRGIRTLDGRFWPMAGIIDGEAVMHDRLQALGYVEVETRAASILGPPGQHFRGHQFRYSTLAPIPANSDKVYAVKPRWGAEFAEGYRTGNVVASYVHAHWASNPAVAEAFVSACASHRNHAARRSQA